MTFLNLRPLWLLFVLPLLASCALLSGPDDAPGNSLERLEEARALWQSEGYENYRFEIRRLCYCAPRALEATVYVRADTVHHTENLTGDGEPIDAGSDPMQSDFPSISTLFDWIGNTNEENRVRIEYDAELGYPRSVTIGNFKVDMGTAYDLANVEQTE